MSSMELCKFATAKKINLRQIYLILKTLTKIALSNQDQIRRPFWLSSTTTMLSDSRVRTVVANLGTSVPWGSSATSTEICVSSPAAASPSNVQVIDVHVNL